MNILFVGDIVGSPGRLAIKKLLPGLVKEYSLDFCAANAENAAGGSGITGQVAEELFASGLDALTSGDHIWKKKEIFELISRDNRILRPANYPPGAPGSGYAALSAKNGLKVGLINVNGRVFMPPLDCPFKAAQAARDALAKETKIIIVDIHAEATSEKVALGWYLDGKVSAVLGTHTHVQTADERLLPTGTAYLTDVGMCGPYDSVIGRETAVVIEKFLTGIPVKFEVAEENVQLQGVVLDIDEKTGKARSIVRVQRKINE
jgi:metallophosphoesterase (TIGR00282 family)